MILYARHDLNFMPLKLRALVNLPNVLLLLLVAGGIAISISLYINNHEALTFLGLIPLIIPIAFRLYVVSKARPLVIESHEDILRIIYRRYFSVREVNILNRDVLVEFFEETYQGYTRAGSRYYLYFYSRTDDSVDVELNDSIYALGKLLDAINKEGKIELTKRELNFIIKYHELDKWNKSSKGKLANILTILLIVALFILVGYCSWPK